MKKIKKMSITFVVLLCIILTMQLSQIQAKKSEDYWPKQSEQISAGAAILMDLDTGTILYKKNIDEKYYPASITKILTTLIAVENSNMDEVVTFSHDAVYKTEGSRIYRDVGEKMTMKECLYAVMLESANECAYAVAEHVGGSYEAFIKMMNKKAKALGCTSSHFNNPHGLPDENHYVTARDMAMIAKAAYENETFRLICGTKVYIIPPTNKRKEQTVLVNHHKMFYPKDTAIYLYDYCIGGKTGFTVAAGNTLVTYAQKGGMSLIAVILNGSTPQYWNETRALFEFGFENFNVRYVAKYAETGDNYVEEKYDTLNVNEPYAQIDPQAKIILPKTVDFSKAQMQISYENLNENVLAQLKYTYGKRKIGTANIIRTNAVVEQNELTNSKEEAMSSQTNIQAEQATKAVDNSKADTEKENKTESDKKFDIKGFFSNLVEKAQDFIHTVSSKKLIILAGIVGGIVLVILIVRMMFHNSYVFRQKIADRKRRKRESKQYIIIRDTRKSRRRGRRNR